MIIPSLNKDFNLIESNWSNAQDRASFRRHRWYYFKEAFSPQLVGAALSHAKLKRSDVVLDPFCGSGTVALQTSNYGPTSIGFEVNPFMVFLARTKLIRAKHWALERHISTISRAVKKGRHSSLEKFSTFSENGENEKWLFNSPVLRAFEGGWSGAESLGKPYRDLFRLALIGAAMDNCNASRDGKCLRYKTGWEKRAYSTLDFIESLHARLSMMSEDLREEPGRGTGADIYLGDCRNSMRNQQLPKFKLCVTSPPYLNSFDYTDVYRPELFLGKFISSNETMRALRLQTIRSHVQVDWEKPKATSFGRLFDQSIQRLLKNSDALWNQRIPLMIHAYFEDLERVLLQLRGLAAKDAHLWIVVSTSAYAGVEIPVDLILAEIGGVCGWALQEVGVIRYMRSSSQHKGRHDGLKHSSLKLRESLVVLRAN